MSTAPKPTIIVIPGSFCPRNAYDPIISDLKSHGYPVHGMELETVGKRDKAPGMYDDAAAVASLVSGLTDKGKDVVLVAHSYGGLVACEASKGLAKSAREKEGKKGGIVRIVFVTAVVPTVGHSVSDITGNAVPVDYVGLEGEYLVITDASKCGHISFSDLPPEEAVIWAAKLTPHSAISFAQKLTYAAYKDIPVSYLFCEDDKLVTPEQQNKIIAGLESEMGGKTVDRHPVKAGHAVNVSQPKTVVDVVRKALGDA
ncbi:Alpha/Beta hydrolase protein [Mycena rosella]|uniref:Alpha/Beta hydrolase protein n=1 Tax=Mycena rosella TaxID=1033263 RepID=A0AAD7BV15_MYCRO|nr:Alpha/Beta hydrolase protein [Mycena rosella]